MIKNNGRPMPMSNGEVGLTQDEVVMLMTRPSGYETITREDVAKAQGILQKYKDGKQNLEQRIVEDELWWELRHWEAIGKNKPQKGVMPNATSAWLFNCIINKHADAMDNFPEPLVLPRELSDEESAKMLSSILPVILEQNDFEQTYSLNWHEKLKHGPAPVGVFWNPDKENGLGDIDIRNIDILKLFWEPGITDIQDSRNLFIVDLVDEDMLDQMYPDHAGKMRGGSFDVKQYIYDDTVDISGKAVVVDWYYKVKAPSGKTLVQYVKFVGNELLYASENDPEYRDRGFYDHGLYPVVIDNLFPEKGTPVSFGYVSICKDPQLYIDKLSSNILESAVMGTKKRYFASDSLNINMDEFMDWNNPIVKVQGEIDPKRLQEIVVRPIDAIYANIMQMKVEEMKDTAANRDVNSGGTGSGVTAAAAIAALQEAGNKVSRDMISASYRSYTKIIQLVIELMRQFYDEARNFRITSPNAGGYEFVKMSNAGLRDQVIGQDSTGSPLYRRPVFDLKIKAQKKNPFSRMEQNETAKELFNMGFFNPSNAQQALICLDMMEFEGVDKMKEAIQNGDTLLNICNALMAENDMLKASVGIAPTAQQGASAVGNSAGMQSGEAQQSGAGKSLASDVMQSRKPMTGMAQKMAERSRPDVAKSPNSTTPKGV